MTLEEALIIAQRMEEDGVCGPVGLALRVLLAESRNLWWEELSRENAEVFNNFFKEPK